VVVTAAAAAAAAEAVVVTEVVATALVVAMIMAMGKHSLTLFPRHQGIARCRMRDYHLGVQQRAHASGLMFISKSLDHL
jgi:hypothetical protein